MCYLFMYYIFLISYYKISGKSSGSNVIGVLNSNHIDLVNNNKSTVQTVLYNLNINQEPYDLDTESILSSIKTSPNIENSSTSSNNVNTDK